MIESEQDPVNKSLISHYRIISKLGAGGMGEVYRAHDERLGRDVAIKVLPTEFTKDVDRLRRFEQEARATSALNHPNILTIYDIGTHDGAPYIVSELLEGAELRAQLNEGALPVRKAIDYAQQITQGLSAAHEKGVVHRDLKPENLFVTKDGRVKILDFGLAKLKPQKLAQSVNTDAPTRLPQTDPGTVMGTVGYMSPEQVRGQDADHRSDIFSFGAILYEMLSGQRAFGSGSVGEMMSAILKEEPPELAELNSKIPAPLERLVRHCLEKRPEERFQSARDLAFALGALSTPSGSRLETAAALPAAVTESNSAPRMLGRERWAWIIGGVCLLALLASLPFALAYLRQAAPTDAQVMKLSILPPEKSSFDHIAISPDGRYLAFTAATGGKVQLWVRALDQAEAKPLAGTEGASYPFWSPDNRFIGYFAGGKLKKIETAGGISITLGDVRVPTGGSWSRDGVIIFSSLGGTGLSRVSAAGGEVTIVLRPDVKRQETDLTDPYFLPDGQHFLFSKYSSKETRGIYLGSLEGKVVKRLLDDDSNAAYAAAGDSSGYLLFVRERALLAQGFDVGRQQLTGEPFVVAPQVRTSLGNVVGSRRRNYSVSHNGILVVDPLLNRLRNQLVWVDRTGKKISSLDELTNVGMLNLSPDGQRFVVTRLDLAAGNNDLWLSDVTGKNARRFTFNPANDQFPVWSSDGSRIVWCSNPEGTYDIYQKQASGAGQDQLLLKSDYFKFPMDWSRDGRYLIYREIGAKDKYDVCVLPVGPNGGDQKPFTFLRAEANATAPALSPDGKWMAYSSDESSRYEVYVQSFPGGGGKQQISTTGGIGARWRGDGKELFYHAPDGKLMAVAVKDGTNFEASAPVALFEFRAGGNLSIPYYDVTRDGQRFLLSTIAETEAIAPLTIVVNWAAGAKK